MDNHITTQQKVPSYLNNNNQGFWWSIQKGESKIKMLGIILSVSLLFGGGIAMISYASTNVNNEDGSESLNVFMIILAIAMIAVSIVCMYYIIAADKNFDSIIQTKTVTNNMVNNQTNTPSSANHTTNVTAQNSNVHTKGQSNTPATTTSPEQVHQPEKQDPVQFSI